MATSPPMESTKLQKNNSVTKTRPKSVSTTQKTSSIGRSQSSNALANYVPGHAASPKGPSSAVSSPTGRGSPYGNHNISPTGSGNNSGASIITSGKKKSSITQSSVMSPAPAQVSSANTSPDLMAVGSAPSLPALPTLATLTSISSPESSSNHSSPVSNISPTTTPTQNPPKKTGQTEDANPRAALVREHRNHVAESASSLQKLSSLLTTCEKNSNYEDEMTNLLNKHITASQKLMTSFITYKKWKDKQKNINDDFLEKMDYFGSH